MTARGLGHVFTLSSDRPPLRSHEQTGTRSDGHTEEKEEHTWGDARLYVEVLSWLSVCHLK